LVPVVDVVADLSVFGAFSDDSGGQMAGFLAEVPSRLGNDCEVLVLGKSEDLLLGLREGGGGVAASEIEDLHLVPVLLADLHADGGDVDGLSEAFAAVLAAAAVEVQAVQVDSHLLDLLEPEYYLISSRNLISACSTLFRSSPNLLEKMVARSCDCCSLIEILQRIFIFGATFWILSSSSMLSAVV